MTLNRYLVSLLLLVLLAVCCSMSWAEEAAPKPEPTPTAAERKAITKLVTDFRKTKTPKGRLMLIERSAKFGPAGVLAVGEVVNKELETQLEPYRQQYAKAAGATTKERLKPEALAEIKDLRAKIIEVRDSDPLTKEMIVKTSDPALARLKELLLVSRAEVFAKTPELNKRRQALLPIGILWEACARYLLVDEMGRWPTFDDYLTKEEQLATVLAMTTDPATRSVIVANTELLTKIDPEEARGIAELNLTRNLIGLAPLLVDLKLVETARDHAKDMKTLDFFDHESPVEGKKTFSDRAKRFNTSASGENIAKGAKTGTAANEMWWHSPGHHKNMLGDHHRVGLGRDEKLWTEMFGR